MTLEEVITRFKVKSKSSKGYQCICPHHGDKEASLTISQGNGTILFHCHAGCETDDILTDVGLTMSDLYEETQRKNTWRERLEYGNGPIEAVYNYVTENGTYLYSKIRFKGKKIKYYRIDENNDTYESGKGENTQAVLYRLPQLIKAVKQGRTVYIVEGEKDADNLIKLGYVATTAGGVSNWKSEFAQYFKGARVVIMPDNDEPGMKLYDEIKRDLRNYAHSIKCVITSRQPKGDVSDYLAEGNTKDDLEGLINGSETIYAPWIHQSRDSLKINADILANCISSTLDYAVIRNNADDKDDVYIYKNGVYCLHSKTAVKAAIRRYIPIGLCSDNILNNTYNLFLCREENIRNISEIDMDERYINLSNGLYDIEQDALIPHTPNVLSTLQLSCRYDSSSKSMPNFTRYINDLCRDRDGNIDESKKAVLQEFMGLLLSNIKVSRIKKCLILYSALGDSGKSQFLSLLDKLIGTDKTANVPIPNMNEGCKFSMGSIQGKRIILCGDQSENEIQDSSLFKQLTGGDAIKIEQKGRQPFSYIFRGGIIISCNALPVFKDDKGGHLFNRLAIVQCLNSIPEEKQDRQILDKMLKEKDAIFMWALEGLKRLINNDFKLTECKASQELMDEYRDDSDTIHRFVNECYEHTENKMDRIDKTEFEKAYIEYCNNSECNHVNKRDIKIRMEKNGMPLIKDSRGVRVYQYIKEKGTNFKKVSEDIPF